MQHGFRALGVAQQVSMVAAGMEQLLLKDLRTKGVQVNLLTVSKWHLLIGNCSKVIENLRSLSADPCTV